MLERRASGLEGLVIGAGAMIVPHEQQGWLGHVFDLYQPDGTHQILKLVPGAHRDGIRFRPAAEVCAKERYISEHIADGMRVPKVLGIAEISFDFKGEERIYSVLQLEYLPFPSAHCVVTDYDSKIRLAEQLGAAATILHSTPTAGYGWEFDVEKQRFAIETWADFIDVLVEHSDLEKAFELGVIDPQHRDRVLARIEKLKLRDVTPGLFHYDFTFNWSNVLVDAQTRDLKAVIDWEFGGSGDAFLVDMFVTHFTLIERDFMKGKSDEFIQAFLRGYGMSAEEYQRHLPDIETLVLIFAGSYLLPETAEKLGEEKVGRIRGFVEKLLA